jgi:long-chain acyl-CoA synthetase
MNVFDYFFENTKSLNKDFIKGSKEKLSFNELYHKSLSLAGYLSRTLGTDKEILLISPNSGYFLICYFAILKSGNICIPLSPEIEQKNFDFIRNLCSPVLAFISKTMNNHIDIGQIPVVSDIQPFVNLTWPAQIPEIDLNFNENRIAEIIFTSGSTGEPKGVVISHKNIIANTESIINYLKLNHEDTMLVVLPFYYCYGLSLLHTHIRIGGSIVLNNAFIFLGGVINDLLRFNCTGFAGVPSHFQILLRKSDSFKTTLFPDLRYVTQAGGKLHNAFIREFITSFPDIRFYVMYGQTEATARLSYLPPEMLPEKIGSCGKGIPGVELKVVNENDAIVKPGETGEIIACGDNITQGYYKDETSTGQILRNGWLYTGDLATVDEDGYIFLTARKKEIIKVGGRRISPKEIEEVIVSMPEVIDCSIEGVFDEILGENLKATVITKEFAPEKKAITQEDIRIWCASRLASFKIPQIIELQNNITITATGKKIKK